MTRSMFSFFQANSSDWYISELELARPYLPTAQAEELETRFTWFREFAFAESISMKVSGAIATAISCLEADHRAGTNEVSGRGIRQGERTRQTALPIRPRPEVQLLQHRSRSVSPASGAGRSCTPHPRAVCRVEKIRRTFDRSGCFAAGVAALGWRLGRPVRRLCPVSRPSASVVLQSSGAEGAGTGLTALCGRLISHPGESPTAKVEDDLGLDRETAPRTGRSAENDPAQRGRPFR